MNISKKSWHYKLVRSTLYGKTSHSLCIYFWQVIISMIVVAGLAAVLLCVGVGVLAVIVALLAAIASPILVWAFHITWIPKELVGAGCGLWGLGLGFAIGMAFVWFMKKKVQPKLKAMDEQPNLLVEYLKAKKQKVCPQITFIGEKDETDWPRY